VNTVPKGAVKFNTPFSLTVPFILPVDPMVGVTVTVEEIAALVALVAVNVETFPVPLAAKPTAVFEFVQV
jgi:hypothetical protein